MQSQQRLVYLETGYGSGILFHQEDSALAYKILARATPVSGTAALFPSGGAIDMKLIDPKQLQLVEEVEPPVPSTSTPTADQPCPF